MSFFFEELLRVRQTWTIVGFSGGRKDWRRQRIVDRRETWEEQDLARETGIGGAGVGIAGAAEAETGAVKEIGEGKTGAETGLKED